MDRIRTQLRGWSRAGRTLVHEADTKALLTEVGISVPRRDPPAGPCAVKLCSDRYPHKTEHGLVKLSVSAAEAGTVAATLRERDPGGVALVEEMIADGVAEWIVGCRHDSTFGPIVMIGAGGVLVELVNEAKARLAPVDAVIAARAIRSQRASKMLDGLRGRPSGDFAALVDVVTRVSSFFVCYGELIQQLEINPVIVRPSGCGAVAADALMVLQSPALVIQQ